ncbi:MAG: hypothetical protein U0518_02415 [Candidatus Gracilibacteria bacterium]
MSTENKSVDEKILFQVTRSGLITCLVFIFVLLVVGFLIFKPEAPINEELSHNVDSDPIMKAVKERFSTFRDNTDNSATCRHEPMSCDGESNKKVESLLKIRDAVFAFHSCDNATEWKIYVNKSPSMPVACRAR